MSPSATHPAFRAWAPLRHARIVHKHFARSRRVAMPSPVAKHRSPPGGRRRRNKSATMEVASDPDTSKSARPFSCTVAWKSLRFTAVSSQSFTMSSASRRERPCVSASSMGISANHQRPLERVSRQIYVRPLHAFRRIARASCSFTSAWRGTYSSKRHAGCRDAEIATRMPEDVSPARASSQPLKCTPGCVAVFLNR